MSHGIGVRYTASGVRIVGLERIDNRIKVTGVAAGSPGNRLKSFIRDHGFPIDESVIVCGLCPGDFFSTFLFREEGMDEKETMLQLRWEIERKMLSRSSDYSVDYVVTDNIGCAFATRNRIADTIQEMLGPVLVDVEPVALYNTFASEYLLSKELIACTSVEAEGVSTVLLENGELIALESFPVYQEEISSYQGGKNPSAAYSMKSDAAEHFSGHIIESVNRLITCSKCRGKTTPDRIIVAGGGVIIGEIIHTVEQKTGLPTIASNPFASLPGNVRAKYPELGEMSSVYTSCYGYAVRALEE